MVSEYTLEEGRVYIHRTCGTPTGVAGRDFAGLCNPFEPCGGTFCISCDRIDDVRNFSWADTGECIADYRRRLRRESPLFYRLWTWVISPSIGAIVGALIAWALVSTTPVVGVGLGALFGVLAMCLFVGPWLLCALTGARFYRSP